VDHQCGPVGVKEGRGTATERHQFRDVLKPAGAVSRDFEIRQIAGVGTLRALQTVPLSPRIKVSAGRREFWRVALPHRVEVEPVLPRGESPQLCDDPDAVGILPEAKMTRSKASRTQSTPS